MIDALRRLMSTITQPLTVAEYERRIAAGIIGEDDPVELIEGRIVPKMPKGPRHVMAAKACQRLLGHLLGAGWHVAKEDPVRIPDQDEPEPDVTVVRGAATDYPDHHPGPGDIPLLVEVAESSLSWDGLDEENYRPTEDPPGRLHPFSQRLCWRQGDCHVLPRRLPCRGRVRS